MGHYSIRVNERWRICFAWRDGEAWEVEIVDLPLRRWTEERLISQTWCRGGSCR